MLMSRVFQLKLVGLGVVIQRQGDILNLNYHSLTLSIPIHVQEIESLAMSEMASW